MSGITWNSREALRGSLCALPAVPILLAVDVSLGVCLALGSLPVAMLGVPASRTARLRLFAVGAAFAAFYALGCLVGEWPVVAISALVGLAYAGVVLAAKRPAARVVPALLAPAFALGMNEPVPEGFGLAAMFLAGGAWATVVAVCWPAAAPAQASPPPAGEAVPVRHYAALFATAAGLGLALGHLLDLAHVAWAAAAAMFIMRPDPALLASRALGRTLATLAGVCAAALVYQRGPAELAVAVLTVGVIAAILAVRASPWYVTAAGTGLLVVLMSGVSSTEQFSVAFHDRLLETAIGAALALAFGVGVPALTRSA